MKIVKIQERELNEARELQKKCIDLHLPSPPVVLWNATITDKNGVKREQTIAKANSYVRNALNLLSTYVGMTSSVLAVTTAFKDGLVNVKTTNGVIMYPNQNAYPIFALSLGDSLTPNPETLNSFETIVRTGAWGDGGSLHYTDFEESSRKLITQFIKVLVNTSNNTQYISEAGIHMTNPSSLLMLRDVFTPIAVGAGESIRFVYQTEVLYPL